MATRVKKTETPDVETETTEVTTPEPTGTSVQALLDEVEKATGKDYQPATIRVLLRKLAKEGKLQKGEGRWSLTDEEVETVIEAVQAGRAEKAPKEETADGEEIPWAHIDVASPAWNTGGPYGFIPARATGVPVRTIVETIRSICS